MAKPNPDSIWLYNPNFSLAILAAILYAILMAIQFWQTVLKHKAYYFIVVLVGACLEVGGYAARAVSIKHQNQIPPYAVQSSFIVLAPLFVAAGNYLLISRLCLRVLSANHTHIYRVPVARLTRIFVICDIISFLVQVAGSGIASSNNWKGGVVEAGTNVLIVGLAIQLVTFIFFMAIMRRFHQVTKKGEMREHIGEGWKKILVAVYISSMLIIVRSIYRLIEFSLGIFGYPFTHEWMFYVFESIPMLPAIGIFCLWHPAQYLGGRETKPNTLELESGIFVSRN